MFMLPWLLAIPLAIADQTLMTVIVRLQYLRHKSLWESDGRPRGMFWIPEESMLGGWYVTYSSAHALRRLTWNWLLFTPTWIAKDRDTHRLLWMHRIMFPLIWICIVAPFAIAFIASAR